MKLTQGIDELMTAIQSLQKGKQNDELPSCIAQELNQGFILETMGQIEWWEFSHYARRIMSSRCYPHLLRTKDDRLIMLILYLYVMQKVEAMIDVFKNEDHQLFKILET